MKSEKITVTNFECECATPLPPANPDPFPSPQDESEELECKSYVKYWVLGSIAVVFVLFLVGSVAFSLIGQKRGWFDRDGDENVTVENPRTETVPETSGGEKPKSDFEALAQQLKYLQNPGEDKKSSDNSDEECPKGDSSKTAETNAVESVANDM
jgi:hypothetical protein